jgi:hypothetical protein
MNDCARHSRASQRGIVNQATYQQGDTVLGGEAELRHTLSKRQAYFTAARKHPLLYEALQIFYSVHLQAFYVRKQSKWIYVARRIILC